MLLLKPVTETCARSIKTKHKCRSRPKTPPNSKKEIEESLTVPRILTKYTVATTQKHTAHRLISSALRWSLFEMISVTYRLAENVPSLSKSTQVKFLIPSCGALHCGTRSSSHYLQRAPVSMSALCPCRLCEGNYWSQPVERTPQFCPSLRPSLPLQVLLLRWGPPLGSWLHSHLHRSFDTVPLFHLRVRLHPRFHIFHHSAVPAQPTLVSLLTQRCLQNRYTESVFLYF